MIVRRSSGKFVSAKITDFTIELIFSLNQKIFNAGTNSGLVDRKIKKSAGYWSTNVHRPNKRDRSRILVQVS